MRKGLLNGGQPLLRQHPRPKSPWVPGVCSRHHRSVRVLCCFSVVLVLLYSHTIAFCSTHFEQEAWLYRGVLRWNVPDGKYAEVAAAKAMLPKTKDFQGFTPETLQQQLPIYVISLSKATGRRTAMTRTMAAAGVSGYQLVDAADSQNASSIAPAELRRYVHGWRRYMWRNNRTRYSGKVAVDVSHFRVWERVAASNTAAIILEDDVRLTGQTWSRDLLTVLNELPEDWDVLYLQIGCCHKLGRNVSTHLVPVFGTAGAMAYMMTPAFAREALRAASSRRLNSWIDVMLMLMGRHFESKQYAARPPLVTFSHLPSTLTHYMEPASDSYWEAKWIKYGNLGLI